MSQPSLNPCVYCGAPWYLESVPIDHEASCPTATGLYPVSEPGLACWDCGSGIAEGDVSCRRTVEEGVDAVVCMACALRAVVAPQAPC